MMNELKQNVKLTQNSNEKKLKRKNRTIDRAACDDKSIKSKAFDARNKFDKDRGIVGWTGKRHTIDEDPTSSLKKNLV